MRQEHWNSTSRRTILCSILLLLGLHAAFGYGGNEDYSMHLGSSSSYFHFRLKNTILKLGYERKVPGKIENSVEKMKIISQHINDLHHIHLFEPDSFEMIQEVSDYILSRQSKLYAIVDDALVTSNFIPGLIFLHSLPSITGNIMIPWSFVGLDIEKIIDLQLAHIRKTFSSLTQASSEPYSPAASPHNILVLLVEEENQLHDAWLTMLLSKKGADETIITRYLTNYSSDALEGAIADVPLTTTLPIITLSDEAAMEVGSFLTAKFGSEKQNRIIGFGGSPEARKYLEQGITTMTIVPDYEDYAQKIFAHIERMKQEIHTLSTQNYALDRPQTALAYDYISVSALELE